MALFGPDVAGDFAGAGFGGLSEILDLFQLQQQGNANPSGQIIGGAQPGLAPNNQLGGLAGILQGAGSQIGSSAQGIGAGQAAGGGGGLNLAQKIGVGTSGIGSILALVSLLQGPKKDKFRSDAFQQAIQAAENRALQGAARRGLRGGGAVQASASKAIAPLQLQLAQLEQGDEQQRKMAILKALFQLGMLGAGAASGNPAIAFGGGL